ncbi:MAG: lipid-A-disaccharide synthase N-terminal domain-containing protein [Candidatus Tectomicrobia bacterium]|nr:lipid-A-disaccharide synthase N-terminal domain-containing protein [Candidatus Tectomicrobia bacterium]
MEILWLALGLAGQALFAGRFFVQWLASERSGKSVIPLAFWYLSLSGGALLLVYAIWRKDPVFILGQTMGVFIYSRNLILIWREKKAPEQFSEG